MGSIISSLSDKLSSLWCDRTLDTYTGESIAAKARRLAGFASDTNSHQKIVLEVSVNAMKGAVAGGGMGGALGCLGALIVNPPAAATATLAGLVAGGLLGGYYCSEEQLLSIQNSPEYTEWLSKEISKIYRDLGDLCKDVRLQKFHCGLRKELMAMPMLDQEGQQPGIDKTGHRWEKAAIFAHIDQHGGKEAPHPLDPNLPKIKKDDLKFDADYHKEIQTELKKMEPGSPANTKLAAAVSAFGRAVNISRSQIAGDSAKKSFEDFFSGKITLEEFQRQTTDLAQKLRVN